MSTNAERETEARGVTGHKDGTYKTSHLAVGVRTVMWGEKPCLSHGERWGKLGTWYFDND